MSYLAGANFKSADLRQAKFTGLNLTGANFSGAILEQVDFSDAILEQANFEGANLERANLKGANLSNANLTEAILINASNLSYADFTQAILDRTDLRGADTLEPIWHAKSAKYAIVLVEDHLFEHYRLIEESFQQFFQDRAELSRRLRDPKLQLSQESIIQEQEEFEVRVVEGVNHLISQCFNSSNVGNMHDSDIQLSIDDIVFQCKVLVQKIEYDWKKENWLDSSRHLVIGQDYAESGRNISLSDENILNYTAQFQPQVQKSHDSSIRENFKEVARSLKNLSQDLGFGTSIDLSNITVEEIFGKANDDLDRLAESLDLQLRVDAWKLCSFINALRASDAKLKEISDDFLNQNTVNMVRPVDLFGNTAATTGDSDIHPLPGTSQPPQKTSDLGRKQGLDV